MKSYTIVFALLLVFVIAACSPGTTDIPPTGTEAVEVTVSATPSITPTPTVTPTPTSTSTPTRPAPTNTAARVTQNACTPRTDWMTYTVVRGDTLERIANRTGSTVRALTDANCLNDANSINVGDTPHGLKSDGF